MTRPGWLLTVLVVVATVAGCSGVPSSSAPEVVRTVGLGETSPVPTPPSGADPRTVVQDFLSANKVDPDRHNAARAYLAPDAGQKWTDTAATVVDDGLRVGTFEPSEVTSTGSVVVTYQPVGYVSSDGIYSPTLAGNGVGQEQQATFSLTLVGGQWRIAELPPGLLLRRSDFADAYGPPRPLYFLDAAGDRLVPDLRYSALTDQALSSFLLAQLIAGPRPELANAVTSSVPSLTGQQRSSVTVGTPTVVQLPGSAGLAGAVRLRLAAQLAATLRLSSFGSALVVRDGTTDVPIPGVGNPFDVTDFQGFAAVQPSTNSASTGVTFVRGGAVYDSTGKPIAGVLGTARFALDTAVFDHQTGATGVAGTTGPPEAARLLVGSTDAPTDAQVPAGPLTSPVWAPRANEVWTASGGTVYRVEPGKAPGVVQATSRTGPLTGSVTAMAFSPEGTRLALVIRSPDATTSQVWIAAVVRSGPDVRLDQLEPITPQGLVVDDVGWWHDDSSLLAVGQDTTRPGSQGGFWQLRVDGSALATGDAAGLSAGGLPDRPRTVAVSPTSGATWVTVGTGPTSTVWVRPTLLDPWVAPSGGASEPGAAPAFAL